MSLLAVVASAEDGIGEVDTDLCYLSPSVMLLLLLLTCRYPSWMYGHSGT